MSKFNWFNNTVKLLSHSCFPLGYMWLFILSRLLNPSTFAGWFGRSLYHVSGLVCCFTISLWFYKLQVSRYTLGHFEFQNSGCLPPWDKWLFIYLCVYLYTSFYAWEIFYLKLIFFPCPSVSKPYMLYIIFLASAVDFFSLLNWNF